IDEGVSLMKFSKLIVIISAFIGLNYSNIIFATNYNYYCSCTPVAGGCPGSGISSPCCRCYEPGRGVPTWDPESASPSVTIGVADYAYLKTWCNNAPTPPGANHLDLSHSGNIKCDNTENIKGIPSVSYYRCFNYDVLSPSTLHVN